MVLNCGHVVADAIAATNVVIVATRIVAVAAVAVGIMIMIVVDAPCI
ncbi:hypothetical protein A2U01_0063507, partial [Trifolium medium]|nr:hypothetical protein [Trifolium medium]